MIIETHELRKTYHSRAGGKRRQVDAVGGIDLAVKEGEIFGFLGPNGAGKSTTLNILATLTTPDSGEATVAGADLRRAPREVRRRLGYVSQRGGTSGDVTAVEELTYQGRLHGQSRAAAASRAAELIGEFELGDFAERRCRTYSGGQRRRLDIALGVMHKPIVLLLDEPSAALDPVSRSVVWEAIRRLRAEGTSVVVTTHYMDEADALCDRICILDSGVIVADGTPEELKQQVAGDVITLTVPQDAARAAEILRDHRELERLELAGEDTLRLHAKRGTFALAQILRQLETAGVSISAAGLHQPSLDDVFLDKTGRSLHATAPASERRS